jgi:glutamyl/glutaminyl-tRNA synthetase
MRDIISRFAPAPTGFLHLGHVVNAVYVWRETRARNGRILLRIEDHDRQRSLPQFEAAMLEDLTWLGFAADEPPVRQSERGAIYEEALDRLRTRGLVYACSCSRADIVKSGGARAPIGPIARRGRPSGRPAAAGPGGPAVRLFEVDAAHAGQVQFVRPQTTADVENAIRRVDERVT